MTKTAFGGKRYWSIVLFGVGLAVFAGLFKPAPAAAAVTCTITGAPLSFGTINPYSGFPYSASGNSGYSCINNGTAAVTVYACISVGYGSGGTSSANRTLASGSNTIGIQITGGSQYPYPIGDGTAYAMEGPLTLGIGANATATGTYSSAASMPQPGSAPPPGSYTSSFNSTQSQVFYTATSAPSSCTTLVSGSHSTAAATFTISATVPTQCTVSSTSLSFPTASVLHNAVNATATISTTCNTSTPVTVALDNGATGTGPTSRQMKSGANVITYGIYRDAGATMPWGNSSGSNTASVSGGTGTLTAYGVVPPQTSPPPGSYADVVNVTITY